MIDIAEKETRIALVNDQPNIAANSHRPKFLVLRPIELVQLHAGVDRIHLQVERCRLDGRLFLAGQPCEAVRLRVGDSEVHGHLYLSISIYT